MGKLIQYLSWDSEFFDLRIGRLGLGSKPELEETLKSAPDQGYDCLYFNVPAQQVNLIRFATQQRMLPVELKVILSMETNVQNNGQDDRISEHPSRAIKKQLENLALDILAPLSRFAADPLFGLAKARKLYQRWIETTLDGTRAQSLFFALNPDGKTLDGFLSLSKKSDNLAIDLIAVAPDRQGQGLGKALMQAAAQQAASSGYSQLEVATQGKNILAIQAYERVGFRLNKIEHCFHIHPNQEIAS